MAARPADRSDTPPAGTSHLSQVLRWRVERTPDAPAFVYLADGERETERWTYRELDARAGATAGLLARAGLAGRPVLLGLPPGLDYVAAFLGCALAGAIAVPAHPPDRTRARRLLPRLRAMVEDAGAAAALSDAAHAGELTELLDSAALAEPPRVLVLERGAPGEPAPPPAGDADDVAFVMYTSGSTATPKGAVITHGNVLHNLSTFPAFPARPCTGFVSWLPFFHDLGLLFGLLHPLYRGVPAVLMPPEAFVQRPLRWLAALARYGASATGAPNFAYDLCVRGSTPEQRAGLDLRAWNVALNGSEPVRAETLERFARAFGPHGFAPETFYASYGMAEGTATVSGGVEPAPPVVRAFDRRALERSEVREVALGTPGARLLVGCGGTVAGQELAIVDPRTGARCDESQAGEVWVAGPSVARGYWRRPEESQRLLAAGLDDAPGRRYLRTGDLGFLREGELFLTGRLKDLVIVRGVNHHPEDVEHTVERCHPALRPGCGAAFAVDVEGEERLVLVQEVGPLAPGDEASVLARVRAAVADEHALDVHAVELVKPGTVPKTSSGKIRRGQCRDDYLAGRLATLAAWRREDPPAEATATAEAPAPADRDAIRAWLLRRVAAPTSDPHRPFSDYGLSSLDAVRLVAALEDWLGRPLTPSLLWEYPTVEALARHLAPDGAIEERAPAPAGPSDEPIAIIGMSCRFPGAGSPDDFWRVLRDGLETVGDAPVERWDAEALHDPDPTAPGRIVSRRGGFLDSLDRFDAAFFGISPREAAHVDPRQRLLLELAWEALEDAGLPPDGLAGSPTAVMVASLNNDYDRLVFADLTRVDAFSGPGTANSLLANRLSYVFDLRGPSLTLDTACSGSLVAIHLACRSLRDGESRLALCGGVNVNLLPTGNVFFSRAGALSPDGRCQPFDARANGIVRSEGAALVVLKRLSQALQDGDRIHAVIRGGAVNHDGHSNGVMAPNGKAQVDVLRAAYAAARLDPAAVQYVEAHGTGTALGDLIEAQALGAVVGAGRRDRPCRLGSLKGNLGHMEPAAGVAGVLKVALAFRHRTLPASLHVEQPNPLVPFAELGLCVQRETSAWTAEGAAPLVASVSSFGFGGTNAHLVLTSPPAQTVDRADEGPDATEAALVPLSARSRAALAALVERWREWLAAGGPDDVRALAAAAARGRSALPHRAAFVARTRPELVARLEAFARAAAAAPERIPGGRPRVIFVFSGQGSQHARMGLELARREPVFRARLAACDAWLRAQAGWSLLDALGDERALDATGVAQPAVFALQVALADLWRHWGLAPDVVIGQSLGEVAAACVAGALTLEDGLRVVVERSRLMQTLAGHGRTAVVGLPVDRARLALVGFGEAVGVAGVSSPETTVVSGETGALERLVGALAAQGTFARLLPGVDLALHSPAMEALRPELERRLAGLRPRRPDLPLGLALTGGFAADQALDGAYWARNLAEPFQLAPLAARLFSGTAPVALIEVSPHPLLSQPLRQAADAARAGALVVGSLRRARPERESLLLSLAELFTAGCPVDWSALHPRRAPQVALPHYPWQRERHWIDQVPSAGAGTPALPGPAAGAGHALLGAHTEAAHPPGTHFWTQSVSATHPARYLADHRLLGRAVFPAAAYLELAWAAARAVTPGAAAPVDLEDVRFTRALPLEADSAALVQTQLEARDDGGRLRVFSRSAREGEAARFTLHASLRLRAAAADRRPPAAPADLWTADDEEISGARHYQAMEYRGLQYGPAFRALAGGWRRPGQAVARLRLPAALEREARQAAGLHPALLDAVLQVAAAAAPDGRDGADASAPRVPVSLERVRLHRPGAIALVCRATLRAPEDGADALTADVQAWDADGAAVLEVQGLRVARLGADPLASLFEVQWPERAPQPEGAARGAGEWVVLADRGGVAEALAGLLRARGQTCALVPASSDALTALSAALERPQPPRAVVDLRPLDAGEAAHAFACAEVVQSLVRADWLRIAQAAATASLPRLWLVTRGAQRVVEGDRLPGVAQAALWGLGRTVALEHPDVWGGALDLDPQADDLAGARAIETELLAGEGEERVAYRDGRRHVARLARARARGSAFEPRRDATYLVTGGLGGLGLTLARGLVERGARHLLLLGPTPLPPRREWRDLAPDSRAGKRVAALRTLEATGARVHVESVDVADRARLEECLDVFAAEGWPEVRGVFHAAGVLRSGLLLRLDERAFDEVLRPKVQGALALHETFGPGRLDAFVLFSSLAGVTGALGQAAYAAGNAFLDALAWRRRASGLPGLSVAWGPWSEVGMAAEGGFLERFAHEGVQPFAPDDGLDLLWRLLGSDGAFVAARVDWSAWLAGQPPGARRFVEGLAERAQRAPRRAAGPEGAPTLLEARTPEEIERRVEAYLLGVVAQALRMDPEGLDPERPLSELGVDSIVSTEIAGQVSRDLGARLPVVDLVMGHSLRRMAGELAERLRQAEGRTADATAE